MIPTQNLEAEWAWLAQGTPRQQQLWQLLAQTALLSRLSAFQPQLVGTIPLAIDHAHSDVDIVLTIQNQVEFAHFCQQNFGNLTNFIWQQAQTHCRCQFEWHDHVIELYAVDAPSTTTNGYRHFVIEQRLLTLFGEPLRAEIQALKQNGLKTEPAFATVFGLSGDPYAALFCFESLSDAQIIAQYHTIIQRLSC